MLWAVLIIVLVVLALGSAALNRRTVARYLEDGTMPRNKRLQGQVVAAAAKIGEVPTWYVDPDASH